MSADGPRELQFGYSPCPNDTFAFHALSTGLVATGGARVHTVLEDVEALNRRALRRDLDITKLSFHAFALVRDRYTLLRAGAALGRGCGPLVVARKPLAPADLAGAGPVAIPGELTTAALLLRLFAPAARDLLVLPFDRIFQAVLDGRARAGVIIHEGRFTFAARGLHKVLDLGEWWEAETGLPIPLGCIAAATDLGEPLIRQVEGWVRASVERARARPDEPMAYVRSHAQEMDPAVVRSHIDLYVNDATVDLGPEGERAVDVLLAMAEERGVIPSPSVRRASRRPPAASL